MNEYLIKLKNFTLDFWQDNDVRIYLFGSWARGEARQSSDVDIAIESKSGVKIDSALEYKVNEFREALENSDITYICIQVKENSLGAFTADDAEIIQ